MESESKLALLFASLLSKLIASFAKVCLYLLMTEKVKSFFCQIQGEGLEEIASAWKEVPASGK